VPRDAAAVVVEHAAVAVVVERVAVAVEELQLFGEEEQLLGFEEEEAQEVDFRRDALLLRVAGERRQGNRHQTS